MISKLVLADIRNIRISADIEISKFFRIRFPHPKKPSGAKDLNILATNLRNTCTYLKSQSL